MSINTEQYIKRNLLGFEGDGFIKQEIEKLRDKFKATIAIETGSFLAGTSKVLGTMFEQVFTCELMEDNFKKSEKYLEGIENVSLFQFSSPDFLNILLREMPKDASLLFFLDAHFFEHCPLLEELHAIAYYKFKPVIVIHDWKVPDRPDLGYDSYNGQDFTFEWIKEAIDSIYGKDGYYYHFNGEAEGAKRGCIYIYPTELNGDFIRIL